MFIFTHCQYGATINLLLSPFLRCRRYLPRLYVYLSAFTNVDNSNIAESVRGLVVRYDYCVCVCVCVELYGATSDVFKSSPN